MDNLNEIKEFFEAEEVVLDIDWIIEMIASNKLYDVQKREGEVNLKNFFFLILLYKITFKYIGLRMDWIRGRYNIRRKRCRGRYTSK